MLKAIDRSLDRELAIKLLNPAQVFSSTARRRFIREAQAAAAINHPNVVTIYAVEEGNGRDHPGLMPHLPLAAC